MGGDLSESAPLSPMAKRDAAAVRRQRLDSSVREPEIDGSGDSLRAEGQSHPGAGPGGVVAGEENLLHDATILAGGLRGILAANASGEVMHLLREPVIPEFLEHWPGPTLGGRAPSRPRSRSRTRCRWGGRCPCAGPPGSCRLHRRFRCGPPCPRDGPSCPRPRPLAPSSKSMMQMESSSPWVLSACT
jgi:hypothetical protein